MFLFSAPSDRCVPLALFGACEPGGGYKGRARERPRVSSGVLTSARKIALATPSCASPSPPPAPVFSVAWPSPHRACAQLGAAHLTELQLVIETQEANQPIDTSPRFGVVFARRRGRRCTGDGQPDYADQGLPPLARAAQQRHGLCTALLVQPPRISPVSHEAGAVTGD
jgi:hypothetical protein